MHEIAKHEFLTWVTTLNLNELTEFETTLLAILIGSFEEIASAGTASGQRAKVLWKKIKARKNETIKKLPEIKVNALAGNKIERIESLEVEKFRGFYSPLRFDFKEQYTFFHGPNGSGKTSFCEALEYCLLGTIEEATARNIALEKYVTHTNQKKAVEPVLKCKYSSGEIKQCEADYSKYRFGLIEKNRIDGFSHISAVTPKTQMERMAALFGLSEFQEYVKGFTTSDSFGNERYINTTSPAMSEYVKAKETIDKFENERKDLEGDLDIEKTLLENLIKALGNPDIKTLEDVKFHYTEPKNGIIPKYTIDLENNKWPVIEDGFISNLEKSIIEIISNYDELQKSNNEILSDISAVNLVDLFKAVTKVGSEKQDVCPACKTPLSDTVVNPFDFARNELERMKRIEIAKKTVIKNAKSIVENYGNVIKSFNIINKSNLITDVSLLEEKHLQASDVEKPSQETIMIFEELRVIMNQLATRDKAALEIEYNDKAKSHNKQYEDKLNDAQKTYDSIIEKNSSVVEKQKNYDAKTKEVAELKDKIESLKKKADSENVEIDFNKKMIEAYGRVLSKLTTYVSGLPASLALNLSDKAKEYYNFINDGDADFELIKNLNLPISSSDKISLEMGDGIYHDALQILSEGHVKVLGLSLLLAKVTSEKLSFLVFDDIVNSIDDDHRDGVARLLMKHDDFKKVQMILTCHGEVFVTMLEGYKREDASMERYMFLPADTLEERGIFIRYQDPAIPLSVARKCYDNNQLKDSAMNCRRAVECITGKLWKKLSGYINGGISVKLRKLQGVPDLYNVTQALFEHTKAKYVKGADEVNKDLEELLKQSMWTKLNKGTHEDDSIPEFNRNEIKRLLEIVEKTSKDIDGLKINVSVIKNS